MRRITETLHQFLPGDYRQQLGVLSRIAPEFGGFEAMFFPDFVAEYGLDDFSASVAALELFTQYSSSEYAVRPFIVRLGERMMAQITRWAAHPNEHVRRLASEGSRPRLHGRWHCRSSNATRGPCCRSWRCCAADPSEYVRRSVANNLNDIAKDHADVVLEIAQRLARNFCCNRQAWATRMRTLLKRAINVRCACSSP